MALLAKQTTFQSDMHDLCIHFFWDFLTVSFSNLSPSRTCARSLLDRRPKDVSTVPFIRDQNHCTFCRCLPRKNWTHRQNVSAELQISCFSLEPYFLECNSCKRKFCSECIVQFSQICRMCDEDKKKSDEQCLSICVIVGDSSENPRTLNNAQDRRSSILTKEVDDDDTSKYNSMDPFDIKGTFSLQRDSILSILRYRSCDLKRKRTGDGSCGDCFGHDHTNEERLLICSDNHDESSRKVLANKTFTYNRIVKAYDRHAKSTNRISNEKRYSGAKWFTLLRRKELRMFVLSTPPYCRHFYICPDPSLPVDLALDLDEEVLLSEAFLRPLDIEVLAHLLCVPKNYLSSWVECGQTSARYSRHAQLYALLVLAKVLIVVEASYRYLFNDCIGTSAILSGCRTKSSTYKISFHVHIRPQKNKNRVFKSMNQLCAFVSFMKDFPECLQPSIRTILDDIVGANKLRCNGNPNSPDKVFQEGFIQKRHVNCIDLAIYRPWQPIRLPHCSKRDDSRHFSVFDHSKDESALRFFPPIDRNFSNTLHKEILEKLFVLWEGRFNALSEEECFELCLVTRKVPDPESLVVNICKDNYYEVFTSKHLEAVSIPVPFNKPHQFTVTRKPFSNDASVGDLMKTLQSKSPVIHEGVHPIDPSKVYTTGMEYTKHLPKEGRLFQALVSLIRLTHPSFDSRELRRSLGAQLKTSTSCAPFIYIRQHLSTFCFNLKRKHNNTYGQFKLYLSREKAAALVENGFIISRADGIDDLQSATPKQICDILGVVAMYFICWSNDCHGDAVYLDHVIS